MSNQLILKKITNNGKEKQYNNILYLLSNNIEINNNKMKLVPIGEFLIDKNPLKIKCRIKGLKQKFLNQNNKLSKINNIFNDYQNFRLNNYNYNKKIDSSVVPNTNLINESNKLNKFTNNNMEREKIILPKINHKKSLPKEMSYVCRRNLKEIKLKSLFLNDKNFDNNNDDIIKRRKMHNVNSEWNMITKKEKKDYKDIILKDMAFSDKSNSKFSNVNHEKTNSSSAEKYKNGAQRLKELRKQKLLECNKLIKKFEFESENKKKVLKDYLELMKQNFENNEEFNTKI